MRLLLPFRLTVLNLVEVEFRLIPEPSFPTSNLLTGSTAQKWTSTVTVGHQKTYHEFLHIVWTRTNPHCLNPNWSWIHSSVLDYFSMPSSLSSPTPKDFNPRVIYRWWDTTTVFSPNMSKEGKGTCHDNDRLHQYKHLHRSFHLPIKWLVIVL